MLRNSSPIIYGIPNCDNVKKAMEWCKRNKIEYTFHNYKTEGITAVKIKSWCKTAGWQLLLNKKSTTWKNIGQSLKKEVTTEGQAIKLMQEHTTLIKRPVIEINGTILIGYDEEVYTDQLLTR